MALAVVSAAVAARTSPSRAVTAIERHPDLCWLVAFGVYCTFAFRLDHHAPTFRDHLAEGLFALLVVLPAVFVGEGRGFARSVLRNRVLAWLGLISYGLYLWHGPVLIKLSRASFITSLSSGKLVALTITSVAVTVACATLSYYFLERRVLRFKDSDRTRRESPIGH